MTNSHLTESLAPFAEQFLRQRSMIQPISRLWFSVTDKDAFDTIIGLSVAWMQGTPKSSSLPRSGIHLPKEAQLGQPFDVTDSIGANPTRAVRVDGSDGSVWAGRLDFPDPDAPRTWITEIFTQRTSGEPTRFGVQLTCVLRGECPRIEFTRPSLVREVITRLAAEADGVTIREHPAKYSKRDIDELASLLYNTKRRLPVIVVSRSEAGLSILDSNALAKRVGGAAHIAEIDADASWEMTKSIGKKMSTFQGAARLYFPGLSEETEDPFAHPLWLYREGEGRKLIDTLAERILPLDFMRAERASGFLRFATVRDAAKKLQAGNSVPVTTVTELQAKLQEAESDRDTYAALALEQQNKRIESDAELERMRDEHRILKSKLDYFQHVIQDTSSQPIEDSTAKPEYPLANYDELEDWVRTELSNKVVIHREALKDCRKNGHISMVKKIEQVLRIIDCYWIPARISQDRNDQDRCNAELLKIGFEDAPCFVDREEAKRTNGYSVIHDGAKVILYHHLKFGNGYDNANQVRIYYSWINSQKVFLIGKMPSHLRNNLTN